MLQNRAKPPNDVEPNRRTAPTISDASTSPSTKPTDGIVVETCPHCDNVTEMKWDVEIDGYRAFCPFCGEKMMLCDECIQDFIGRGFSCSLCDWHKDRGCFRERKEKNNDYHKRA